VTTREITPQLLGPLGCPIDKGIASRAIHIAQATQSAINAELQKITDGALATVNQPKIREWLEAHGCNVSDIQKTTLQKALTQSNLPPTTRRVP
jgi:hypothetical protein